MVAVLATDHRWVRILAPLAYVASVGGLVHGAGGRQHDQRLPLVAPARRHVHPARRSSPSWPWSSAWRSSWPSAPSGAGAAASAAVEVVAMLAIAGVPAALILLQPDLGTMLVLSATVFGVLAVAGAGRRWLAGLTPRRRRRRRRRGVDGGAQALPGRPLPRLHQPRARPARRRLQHRAGAHRRRQRRPLRPGPLRRLADPLRASCPSSTPTSSSPSPARSSAWSARAC